MNRQLTLLSTTTLSQQIRSIQMRSISKIISPNQINAYSTAGSPTPPQCYYVCQKQFTVLFCENDLKHPPHAESFPSFSIPKQKHSGLILGANSHNKCDSMFLQKELPWMDQNGSGKISSSNEGKLKCPKCSSKVEVWKLSGT